MNSFEEFLQSVRANSREEWSEKAKDSWVKLRIWVQENGEKAAAIALVFGIFIVLAFKLVFSLFILALILGAAIYFLADPKATEELATPKQSKEKAAVEKGEKADT